MNEKDIIQDTIEDLTERIQKSKEEYKKLRNLYEEIRSKIAGESAFRRYLQYRLNNLKKVDNSNAIK